MSAAASWLGQAIRRAVSAAAIGVAALAVAAPCATAQPNNAPGVSNAFQGFNQNRGQPVQIEAAHLEVRDKQKIATFSGGVKVVQGETTMRCKSLVVFYEQKAEDGGAGQRAGVPKAPAQPGPTGSSQINKIEMKGGVTVVQKDQTATGDSGLFDMKSNTVTLTGNVVVSQGPNILRGERLVVDMTTGVSRVESGRSNGPVRMLFQNQGQPGSPSPLQRPQRSSPNSSN